MHMERIVFQKLIEWKDSANRKPLILNGARQVGKTWLLEQLGDKYFDKVAYLVCRKNQALKDVSYPVGKVDEIHVYPLYAIQ